MNTRIWKWTLGIALAGFVPAVTSASQFVEWDEDAPEQISEDQIVSEENVPEVVAAEDQKQLDVSPTTQPTSGGPLGGGAGGGTLMAAFIGGSGGLGGSGGGTDSEALSALGGGGGGGGGGGSGLTGTSNNAAHAPLPAAVWMGLVTAGGIGTYLKSRRKTQPAK